jgi:hypothetical protein
MRLALLIFFSFLAALPTLAQDKGPEMLEILGQPKDVWERLFTLNDNSTVDVNTSTISWSGDNLGRVRFRYSFTKAPSFARRYRPKIQEPGYDH